MATRLRTPRGSDLHLSLIWTIDGAAADLTGATLEAWLLPTPTTALTSDTAHTVLTPVVIDAIRGVTTLTIPGTATAAWTAPVPLYWVARATLADDSHLIPETHHGPLELTPYPGTPCADTQLPPNYGVTQTLQPGGTVALLSPIMSNYILNFYSMTGLTGGLTTTLDGLAATTLAALQNGSRAVLQLASPEDGDTEKIRLEYELTALGADSESAPWIITCDNDATRCWRLDRGTVSKGGQPAAYNTTSGKWHRIWGIGTDGAATASLDPTGFDLTA